MMDKNYQYYNTINNAYIFEKNLNLLKFKYFQYNTSIKWTVW